MMRLYSIIVACIFFLLVATDAYAQITLGNWTYVKIPIDTTSEASDPGAPIDSLGKGYYKFSEYEPTKLVFSDSMNGYFFYSKFSQLTGVFVGSQCHLFSFRTVDGGKTWVPINFNSPNLDTLAGAPDYFDQQCFPSNSQSVFMKANDLLTKKEYLIHSTNTGISWTTLQEYPEIAYDSRLKAAFDDKKVLLFDEIHPKFLESFDGGYNFPVKLGLDTVFQHALVRGDQQSPHRSNIIFDWSDNKTWSLVLNPGTGDSLFPYKGITTLITSDAGNRWQRYEFEPPTPKNTTSFPGVLQFVKASPNLYYFPSYSLLEGAGNTVRKKDQKYFRAESIYGISYLYSPDYGKSWTPEYQFGKRRKAFEAVATNEVWMTVSKKDSITPTDYATLIVNTTDNGLTWKIDSSALNPSDIGVLDGRILAFSDPRHGWCCATNGYDMYIMRYVKPEVNAVRTEGDNVYGTSYYLSLYPNPADNQMNASILSHQIVQSVDIYDYMGRKANYTYTIEKNNAIIDTHKIPNGLYLARVVNSKGSSTSTFIVQH